MKTFANGFTKSEREEQSAKAAGIDLSEYTKLMKKCTEAATNVGGELESETNESESKKDNSSAVKQLDAEIG